MGVLQFDSSRFPTLLASYLPCTTVPAHLVIRCFAVIQGNDFVSSCLDVHDMNPAERSFFPFSRSPYGCECCFVQ